MTIAVGVLTAASVVVLVVAVRGLATMPHASATRRRLASIAPPSTSPSWGQELGARVLRSRPVRGGLGWLRHQGRHHRWRRADRELPALLDQITRHLRSGANLRAAVHAAVGSRTDAATVTLRHELDHGAPFGPAVGTWAAATPTAAHRLVAAALVLAADAGGAVAVVLDGVGETVRDRIAVEREVGALSSQARASAALLVVAPIVFSLLAATADRRVASVLTASPVGWACIAGGLLLDALGAWWMARLIGRVR